MFAGLEASGGTIAIHTSPRARKRYCELFTMTLYNQQLNFSTEEPVIANVLGECLSDIQTGWKLTGYPVVVLGTTSESGRVPGTLLSCFKQEINIEVFAIFVKKEFLKNEPFVV